MQVVLTTTRPARIDARAIAFSSSIVVHSRAAVGAVAGDPRGVIGVVIVDA